MTRLSRWSFPLVLAFASALSGCGDKRTIVVAPPNKGPTTGSLDLRVVGLPPGGNGSVTITGPNNFTFTAAASTVISSLVPGTYTVNAAKVTLTADSYEPTPATQTVTVVASEVTTTVNIS